MAIDRDAIIRDVYLGAGEKAKTLIPRDDVVVRRLDRRLSLRSREGQGDAGGRGRARRRSTSTSGISRCSAPTIPNGKRIGEMMQADLAKIGVNAKLVTFEWGEYRKRAAERRGHDRADGLDGRQRRPRQFLLPARLPGRQAGRQQHPEVVQRRVQRPARQGAHDPRSGRARQDSTRACRRSSTTRRRSC